MKDGQMVGGGLRPPHTCNTARSESAPYHDGERDDTVGGGLRPPRRELAVCELAVCGLVAVVSLVAAAACHCFAPGFGIVFKPLLWPLLVLPFTVRPRYALVTSAVTPLISCALTGMPTLPVALTLSAFAPVVATVLAVLIRTVGRGLRPRRTCNGII